MDSIINISTTSLATLEDFAPPFNLRHPDPKASLDLALSLLETAGRHGADLVCLPETFIAAGLPPEKIASIAESIPGPNFDKVADYARKFNMNVVAGFFELRNDRIHNVAVLINRNGDLLGTYSKMHPTEGEINLGVTPGSDVVVLETDFGRVGLAICFDLNWPSFWSELSEKNPDIVCWLSAYEGGFPLRSNAWIHQFPIVTSVWPYHSRVIDITGKIIANTSRWGRIVSCELNLDKRLFHTDLQAEKIQLIQTKYGKNIHLETFTEEHLFTIESKDNNITVKNIMEEFALIDYQTYVDRCTTSQIKNRI